MKERKFSLKDSDDIAIANVAMFKGKVHVLDNCSDVVIEYFRNMEAKGKCKLEEVEENVFKLIGTDVFIEKLNKLFENTELVNGKRFGT